MKNSLLLLILPLLISCIQIPFRAPENFRKMVACKTDADQDRLNHTEKVLSCVPIVDAFIKSQETYKLDQDELLEAFNAVFGIYFYVKDHGARGLEEIFSRFEEENRTKDMAENVYHLFIKERDFVHAAEFIASYPQYKLGPLPKVSGSIDSKKMAAYRAINKTSWVAEEFRWPTGPSIMVVFSPGCGFCKNFHAFLTGKHKSILGRVHYFHPQDGNFLPDMNEWALKNPSPAYRVVYKEAPFTELMPDWSGTPRIYFFRGKELKATLRGWPKEGHPDFAQHLKSIGLQ